MRSVPSEPDPLIYDQSFLGTCAMRAAGFCALEAVSTRGQPIACVELFTDSVYVGKGMSEWMPKWKANGWKRKEGKKLVPVKNEELWRRLDELSGRHEISFHWIRGHAGHPENERADGLAVAAREALVSGSR